MRRPMTPAVAVVAVALGAPSALAQNYDGVWQGTLACGPSSVTGAPAFAERLPITISNNAISRTRTLAGNAGEVTQRWRGTLEGQTLNVTVDANRGNERWQMRFAGPAASDTRFVLPGGLFLAGDRQVRQCELTLAAAQPAPQSLAATAPQRAQQAREQEVAQLRAAIEAARREAEGNANRALDMEQQLDTTRFEANTVRGELERLRAAAAEAERAQAARVAQAEQQLAAIRQQGEQQVAQIRAALAQAEQRASGEGQRAGQAESRAQQLAQTAEQARREAAEAIERLRAAAAESERVQQARAAAEGALGQIRREAAEAAQRLAAETGRANRAEEALAQLRNEAAQALQRFRDAEGQLTAARAEAQRLAAELAAARQNGATQPR